MVRGKKPEEPILIEPEDIALLPPRTPDSIQVDMFEVQMGLAMLMQFSNLGRTPVTVLADAGTHGGGYDEKHVLRKLRKVMSVRRFGKRRIDLLICTHYCADHLNRLIPIINKFEIGEAWLPPVADDTEIHAANQLPTERNLLAHKFSQKGGETYLINYLKEREANCERVHGILCDDETERGGFVSRLKASKSFADLVRDGDRLFLREQRPNVKRFLEKQMGTFAMYKEFCDCEIAKCMKLGTPSLDEDFTAYSEVKRKKPKPLTTETLAKRLSNVKPLYKELMADPELALPMRLSMLRIIESNHKDAINAKALWEVVQALRKRGVIQKSHFIDDDKPRRFIWKQNERRFINRARGKSEGVELTLLGPSRGWIKRHWDKIPIVERILGVMGDRKEYYEVTESNQLSYVIRFEHDDQGVLVSGDTGCDYFYNDTTSKYKKAMTKAMIPLSVIQVAHHGGHNFRFYDALKDGGIAKQRAPMYFLMSHRVRDTKRPSEAFRDFLADIRKDSAQIHVLFTCRPLKEKVQQYLDLICPPTKGARERGDIQLKYERKVWSVVSHQVKIK